LLNGLKIFLRQNYQLAIHQALTNGFPAFFSAGCFFNTTFSAERNISDQQIMRLENVLAQPETAGLDFFLLLAGITLDQQMQMHHAELRIFDT
jgi:hypothetical protein